MIQHKNFSWVIIRRRHIEFGELLILDLMAIGAATYNVYFSNKYPLIISINIKEKRTVSEAKKIKEIKKTKKKMDVRNSIRTVIEIRYFWDVDTERAPGADWFFFLGGGFFIWKFEMLLELPDSNRT